MKYCIKIYQNCRVLETADEIMIKYTHNTTEIIDFVQKFQEWQRIILDINSFEGEDFEAFITIMREVKSVHPSIAIRCSRIWTSKDQIERFRAEKIDFYYFEPVNSLDCLDIFLSEGVSDILVINEMCFYLKDISEVCKRKNIKVRVYPNVAESSIDPHRKTLKRFFIRPEDVKIYEDFVDVFEFFGDNLKVQPVLMDIYKQGYWEDDLTYLILGLDIDINSNMIAPGWAERRTSCQKRCTFGKCTMCDSIEQLAYDMRENAYSFDHKEIDYEHSITKANLSKGSEGTSIYDDIGVEEEVSEDFNS